MHVHTRASGECKTPILEYFCRESYSEPALVYSLLRDRGMDLVTLTDHDSIDGAEELRWRSDFFVSEELTCRMPSGTEVHVGVYDITEQEHVQLQQRRNDFVALLMYLSERRIFFSVNHVLSCLTGRREAGDFAWFRDYFPAIEARNGAILACQNEDSERLAEQWRKIAIGGSDAHAAISAGTAYTEVPGARNKDEFFAGLRAGNGRLGGGSGSYLKLTRDILLIVAEMVRETHWTVLLAPLALLVPGFTFFNYWSERRFGERWAAEILERPETRRRPQWLGARRPAAEEYL
ncbi:MAG TPA: PHP-associated domain-containing protein [Candidatus Acidoferrales bacterium]|nr:PHP-associated domain-containing protein [Candidatus Acidoferrales bacterium]